MSARTDRLVERLRWYDDKLGGIPGEAADEIERLRAALAEMTDSRDMFQRGLAATIAERDYLLGERNDKGGKFERLEEAKLARQLMEAKAEIERLGAAEADLFDKCGELQKLVWKLEAQAKVGGGE